MLVAIILTIWTTSVSVNALPQINTRDKLSYQNPPPLQDYDILHQIKAREVYSGSGDTLSTSKDVKLCGSAHYCFKNCQTSTTTACQCDSPCVFFDDCCYNVPCDTSASTVLGLHELGINRSQIGCVNPELAPLNSSTVFNQIPPSGLFMIDKCTNLDSDLSTKCHELNSTDVQSAIPVSEQTYGISFKNVYCALCNNIALDDIVWWRLLARCEEDILPNLQDGLNRGISLAKTLRAINDFCPISFGPPEASVSQIGIRPCYPDVVDIRHCLSDTPPDVLDRCNSYTAYIIDKNGKVFRNPECYICSKYINMNRREIRIECDDNKIPKIYECDIFNSYLEPAGPRRAFGLSEAFGPRIPRGPRGQLRPVGTVADPKCETSVTPQQPVTPGGKGGTGQKGQPGQPGKPGEGNLGPNLGLRPISVIVDFSSNSGVTFEIEDTKVTVQSVTCADNQVYDPFIDKCRTLSCSNGYTLIGDRCIKITNATVNECSGDFKITANVSHRACRETSINAITKCLKSSYIESHFIITNESHSCVDDKFGVYTFDTESSSSFGSLKKSYDTIFQNKSEEKLLNTCNISTFTMSLICNPVSDCKDRVTLTNISIENTNSSTVIVSQNTKFQFSSGTLSLQYEIVSPENMFSKSISSASLCNADHFSCSLITLNASLFTRNVTNDELFYEPTGEIYMKNEYMYTPDGQIQICSFLEKNGSRNATRTMTFLAYDTPQIILSLVGCIISMVALSITFLTYCVFAQLRTRAIKSIMNLVAALFTAQLLFLLGGGRTDNAQTCAFIAMALHYLWLCTFTWSTVLAYELNKTFASKMVKTNHEKYGLIYQYLLYGWLTPLIFVGPCIVLHLCDCSDIPLRYGHDGACWIYNQYVNLVVFGVPLVACLIVNIVLFANVIWNLHASKQKTKQLHKNKTEWQRIKEELFIYIKIATLLGFTWIFAFSAAFSGASAIWYIYIIVNSLQGLYIFFAFTLNVRIGRLWAKKIGLKQWDNAVQEESSRTSKLSKSTDLNSDRVITEHEMKTKDT